MNWKKIIIGVVLIAAFTAAVLWVTGPYKMDEVVFEYAVDGDTIIVKKDDKEFTVRMIGIDTPESKNCDINECTEAGVEAARYTKEMFTKGQILYLEYDKDRYDKYGRTLAYVWLRDTVNTNSYDDFRKYCANAIILENTNCVSTYYWPNGKHKSWFEDIELLKKSVY